ncbi:MAG TPA: MiaB/RimO family radical SAM methylthiotransferase [Candidatus Deferrimicrobium sp.]|nr:MiaB/RimO family radical SAM methylthiotransferase [Candidatus Deferrimicrobium sp.]
MAGFLIKTFGCQFNELYSATIADALTRGGHQPSDSLGEASLVIINTCAVREKAEEKAFSFLGEAAKLVGASHIVFMGCTATLDRERAVRIAGRGLNVVEGTAGMEQVLSLVGTVVPLGEVGCTVPRSLFPTADIELIRGCESYCTYCIVPKSRGPEVVVDAGEVLHRAERAIGSGFSELLFLGQNINRYRSSLGGLVETMFAVDELDGNFWFWFLSSHPANFTPEEVKRVMGLRHIEHRLHLPLQSGSDRILERMNRRYSIADYAKLAEPIRENVDWTLTTDIIVGFPGETNDDFAATVDVVRGFRFDGVFLAKYSDRPGTPASRMQDKVPPALIDERHSALLSIVQGLSEQSNQVLVGRCVDVLVLAVHAGGNAFGRSIDGRNVWFSCSEPAPGIGTFVSVTIDHGSREGLYGTRVC